MKSRFNVYVVGASGYLGRSLYELSAKIYPTVGTSGSGQDGLVLFRLEKPLDFDFAGINPGDIIYFAAAISSPDMCANQSSYVWSVNVTGACEFIGLAISRGAFVVFFSSDTVYGELDVAFDDGKECNPSGEYARMKHEVERRFSKIPSFKSIRLSYVFSREDKFTLYLRSCLERGVDADLFHPFYRAVVYRKDVLEALLKLAVDWGDIPEQFINFGGPEVISRIDFAEHLRNLYFHDLKWKVTEPSAEFFRNRPRIIPMTSPVLSRILGRPPLTFLEAVALEFSSL